MKVTLGKTTWEILNRVAKSTELEEKSLRVKTPAVIETRVLKYRNGWLGLRRKLVREFPSYESFSRDLDTELDSWAQRKYG